LRYTFIAFRGNAHGGLRRRRLVFFFWLSPFFGVFFWFLATRRTRHSRSQTIAMRAISWPANPSMKGPRLAGSITTASRNCAARSYTNTHSYATGPSRSTASGPSPPRFFRGCGPPDVICRPLLLGDAAYINARAAKHSPLILHAVASGFPQQWGAPRGSTLGAGNQAHATRLPDGAAEMRYHPLPHCLSPYLESGAVPRRLDR